MAHIDFARRQLTCKLVYCGPGLSGKTTNIEVIHARAPTDRRGQLCSIATQSDRTLFFDYMPLDLRRTAPADGPARGGAPEQDASGPRGADAEPLDGRPIVPARPASGSRRTHHTDGLGARLMIYTVPGQSYYASTRTLVLQGADGVVFVADSDPARLDDNVQAFAELERNLTSVGLSLDVTPIVFQWNKQDLPEAVPPLVLARTLNRLGAPAFPAVAARGEGVVETLQAISRLVLDRCEADLRRPCPAVLDEPPPAPPAPPPHAPPAADDAALRARPTVLDDPLLRAHVAGAAVAPAPPVPTGRTHDEALDVPAARSCPWGSSDHVPVSADDPVIGQTVGGCLIHSHLGEGGMGAVYLARHELLGKDVVVKVLKPQFAAQPRRVERFFLEARAAAKLEHENVVRIQDVGTNDRGLHYIVMQYVEGTNLDQRIRERGPQHPHDATRIVLEVARALVALHAADMIHRDIKAENIVVTPSGGVKVIDFGLVKDLNCDLNLTRQGALIGTPAYIAPEIGRVTTIDGRADIYSLGLTYYYLLTGRPPFAGCEVHDVIFGRARLRSPEALNPAVRPEHRRVLARMIARKRDARYPDAATLVTDLEALLAGAPLEVGGEGDDLWAAGTPERGVRRASSSARQRAVAAGERPPAAAKASQAVPAVAVKRRSSSARLRRQGPAPARRAAPHDVVDAIKDPTRRLGRFVLREVVDAAGPAVLHRAWDLTRAGPALVRTLEGTRRVPPEAEQALAGARRLRHPAIAPPLAHGVSDGRFFLAVEQLPDASDGEADGPRTLESLQACLSPEAAARVGHDLASALAHAHERGLAHGALTPASVLVVPGGRALLLDLGLAAVEAATPVGRARLGARLERAGCLAPEADPGGAATPAQDVYAMGAVLWRALVGRPPSGSGSGSASTSSQLVPDLLAICRRCLDPDPRRRYPGAADLARDLDRFLQGEAPRARERALATITRRAPQAVIAGAIALAVLVGAVVGSAWRQAMAHEQTERVVEAPR